jgi:hypothetical protein
MKRPFFASDAVHKEKNKNKLVSTFSIACESQGSASFSRKAPPQLGRASKPCYIWERVRRSIEPTTTSHTSLTLCFHQDDSSLSDSQHTRRVYRPVHFEHAALGRDILEPPTQCQLMRDLSRHCDNPGRHIH